MESFDLLSYGVEELDQSQMKNVEGGAIALVLACAAIAAICYYYGSHSAR